MGLSGQKLNPEYKCRISRYQGSSGVLYVPKIMRSIFPKGYDKSLVEVFFDDSQVSVVVNFDQYNHLLWGLKKWYLQHKATAGDIVIVEPLDLSPPVPKYRLTFEKSDLVSRATN